MSEGGAESGWTTRSAGLTAQLQALKKALHHKYVQEVTALKEQHSAELRRLREEKDWEEKREERYKEREANKQELRNWAETTGSGQVVLEEGQQWERVEEEVAKVRQIMNTRNNCSCFI